MCVDAPGEVCAANPDAPGFDQQAHGLPQPVHVASGVGLHASHRHDLVVGILRSGVVREHLLSGARDRAPHRLLELSLGKPGNRRMEVADGRRLNQRVVPLDHAELLHPAIADGELVEIENDLRTMGASHGGDEPRLGGLQEQVVAVHVDPVRCRARKAIGPVRVGAGNDEHVDAIEQRRSRGHERLSQRQRRLAARGLVAVLLAEHEDRGPQSVHPAGPRQDQEQQVPAFLGGAQSLETQS